MDQRQAQVDIDRLSDSDKRDLQQSINNEMQKAKIQESVHELTDICWKKCVTGSISSSSLDRKEEPCIQNCVERFLDANEAVLKHLSVMRGQGGM
ncbi:MAG: Mitochondrial import inner membrane translocase subunit tim8 [Alectoria fallacina]|uniref:Mitochondrial import inner membrane translocase subunit n=1 Tax=Alectoria fallacina TaxID=1903189 RepID=A0A8H3F408_9LECA|nr:MAG: Mitochondrial import inner membrane translocase subunit tim8 [Alectoria fallacina]